MAAVAQDGVTCADVAEFGLERFERFTSLADSCQASGAQKSTTRRSVVSPAAASAGEAGASDPVASADLAYAAGTFRHRRAIYVDDDRLDVEQVRRDLVSKPAALSKALRATAALVRASRLRREGNKYRLELEPFRYGRQPMCPDQRFAGQKSGASCTIFLAAPGVMVTAGHCIDWNQVNEDNPEVGDYAVVFGFELRGGVERQEFATDEVYFIRRIIDHRLDGDAGARQDYAVIELDRPVPARIAEPVRLASSLGIDVKRGTRLGVIGHPSGLAKKVSFQGRSQAMEDGTAVRFSAQLNTFKGNSGSPVFLFDDPDVVVGILVEGERDYALDGRRQCARHLIYASEELCNGERCSEKVTKIALVAPYIP